MGEGCCASLDVSLCSLFLGIPLVMTYVGVVVDDGERQKVEPCAQSEWEAPSQP